MAGHAPGFTTPGAKIVSLGDFNAILEAVDSGQPFKVHVVSGLIENDQKRIQLHIQSCTEAISDIKHAGEPCDSRALVKQLQKLQLGNDKILDQILTCTQPEALSELTAAHKDNRIIPLVTAKDGRVFSILAGKLAYSSWAGKYPMGFSQGPARKLGDPDLAAEEITEYRSGALMKILAEVTDTENSKEFKRPVVCLHPKIWDIYKERVAEPVDLESMGLMLRHGRYTTMADFRRHVDLLQQNAVEYNSKSNPAIAAAATRVSSDIYRRMDEILADPPLDAEVVTQIRRVIFTSGDDHSSSGADSNTDGGNGADDGESEGTSCGEGTGSGSEADNTDDPSVVLPLGRLCVSRNTEGDGATVTPYIVVMNLESANKALWLVKDSFTPVGLPHDKEALLDFGGRYNFTAGKLAEDIGDWKVRRVPGSRAGLGSTKVPTLSWPEVEELIRQSSKDGMVLFDVVETQEHAAAVIKEGWDEPADSLEGFIVNDDDDDSRDGNNGNDPIDRSCRESALGTRRRARKRRVSYDTESEDDGPNDKRGPPRNVQTRSATLAKRSSGKRGQERH